MVRELLGKLSRTAASRMVASSGKSFATANVSVAL
jgi:hypothetical protein